LSQKATVREIQKILYINTTIYYRIYFIAHVAHILQLNPVFSSLVKEDTHSGHIEMSEGKHF